MASDPQTTAISAEYHRDLTADTLRGLAILMILVLHGAVMTIGWEDHKLLVEAINRLDSGVQLFFLLSGFVITAAMDRAARFGDGASGFLLRRAAKLLPLYLIFLHANLAFYIWWSQAVPDAQFFRNSIRAGELTGSDYMLHLAMLQGLFPDKLNTFLDGDWSIVNEAYFYLLTPLLLHRLTRTVTGALWTLGASLALAILFSLFLGKYLAARGYFGYYAFPAQLPCFLMGVACYRVRALLPATIPLRVQIAATAVMTLFFVGFARLEGAPLGGHLGIAILFGIALLVLRVSHGHGALGALQWIGRMSYALFLSHLFILRAAYSVLFANGFAPGLLPSLALNMALSIGGAILISWLLFDPIDRYFVRAMARRLSKRRHGSDPA